MRRLSGASLSHIAPSFSVKKIACWTFSREAECPLWVISGLSYSALSTAEVEPKAESLRDLFCQGAVSRT
jgi:hypothetical protein